MLTNQCSQSHGIDYTKCCCDCPWVPLVITSNGFAICVPAAIYHQPLATLHRCCHTCFTLPMVVNTPSPFTRFHNLPCTLVLLLVTFSAKDPMTKSTTLHYWALLFFLCTVTAALKPLDIQCLLEEKNPLFLPE